MFGLITNRLAILLASLCVGVAITNTAAHAQVYPLDLPQTEDAAISLTLPSGIVSDFAQILQVFVGSADECCDDKTPVAGHYKYENNILSFTPAFGFALDQQYVARVQNAQGFELIPFQIGSAIGIIPAAVTEVYPSGDFLPENTLRFYIHFSTPMKPGVAFKYIKLRDAQGHTDEAAFMQFKQELWNEDRTRLTVLIDPGRIKRDVATNLELGPALLEGQTYTLEVEAGWPSADGKTVLPRFSKTFIVGEALRDLPNVDKWKMTSPCQGTRETLEIAFDRPFDRKQLKYTIVLTNEEGYSIQGEVEIGASEMSWHFTPTQVWPSKDVFITAWTELEDVAGNNFRDLLDHVTDNAEDVPNSTNVAIELRACAD